MHEYVIQALFALDFGPSLYFLILTEKKKILALLSLSHNPIYPCPTH